MQNKLLKREGQTTESKAEQGIVKRVVMRLVMNAFNE